MKSNELRIGNLVYYNGNKFEIGVISKIAKSVVPNVDYVGLDIRQDINYQCKHIKPIPFTEEWIARLSMMKIGSNLQIGVITLWKNINDGMYYFRYDGISIKISFIHEIQNLHFALTGKELSYEKLK